MRSEALQDRDLVRAPRRAALSTWIAGSLLVPFAVALALRLGLALTVPIHPVWDGAIYSESAGSIARGLGYTRAAIDTAHATDPTAFYPVGFPAVLAALRLLGSTDGVDLVAQAIAGALVVVGAGLLGRRAGGRKAGRRAAWLVALWPGGVLLSASWLAEPFFALFVVASSLAVAYSRRRRALAATATSALILGAGAYFRPTAIPIALALACGVPLAYGGPIRARALALGRHAAAAAVVLALTLAPWTLRNATMLGGPVLVSTNGGANLLIGTLGKGGFERLPADHGCEGGEIERDRCLARLAIDRILDDPLAWLARGVLKLTHTFGHESSPAQAWASATAKAGVPGEAHALWALAIDRAFWLPFLMASMAGAVLLARRAPRSRVTVAVFAPILALAALHFVFLGGDRYHAAVVPLMAVLAALAMGAMPRGSRAAAAGPAC